MSICDLNHWYSFQFSPLYSTTGKQEEEKGKKGMEKERERRELTLRDIPGLPILFAYPYFTAFIIKVRLVL